MGIRIGFLWLSVIFACAAALPAAAAGERGSARIINGSQVSSGAYDARWRSTVAIHDEDGPYFGQYCGGTLIRKWLVVTAAHCVKGSPKSSVRVFAGQRDLRKSGSRYRARQVIVHPAYDDLSNDIALIVLDRNASQPAMNIPKTQGVDPWPGGALAATASDGPWAAGWGSRDPSGGDFPDILENVRIPLEDKDTTCTDPGNGGWGDLDPATMLCGGVLGGGTIAQDTCGGDSGGPLIWRDAGNVWRLIGLVSFGPSPCGELNFGVYTRVSNYVNWINAHTRKRPYAPAAPTLAKRTIRSLTIRWNAPPGPAVTSYQVQRRSGGKWKVVRTTKGRTATFGKLKPGTRYQYRVVARGGDGQAVSSPKRFRTKLDTARPSPIKRIDLTRLRSTKVRASWSRSSDNHRVARYDVHVKRVGSKRWKRKARVAASRRNAMITGLASGKTYRIRVLAFDPSGNRSRVVKQRRFTTL